MALETVKAVLTLLRLYPAAANEPMSKWKKLARIAFLPLILFSILSFALACFAFIHKFSSTNLDDCLFTLLGTIVSMATLYTMIVAFRSRREITLVIDQLLAIYDEHEKCDSLRFLARANRTCELIWSLCIKFVISFPPIMSMVTVGSIFLTLIYGEFRADNFFRVIEFTLPWNQSTYLGYFGEMCLFQAAGESYLISNGSILSLFILFCIHSVAFSKIFDDMIVKWNGHDNEKSIIDLVRFRLLVKRWFLQTAEIYSPIIMIQLMNSMFVVALSLFQLNLKLQQHDYATVPIMLFAMISGMIVLLPYCYFGKLASESFEEMSDSIYNNVEWYELPIELQRYIMLMLMDMQKTLCYHGFGIIVVGLQTYIRLMRNVVSFYLMFKSLSMEST